MSRMDDRDKYIEELEAELKAARPIVEAAATLERFLDGGATRQVVFQATWASPPFQCSLWQPHHNHRRGVALSPMGAFLAALEEEDIAYKQRGQEMTEEEKRLETLALEQEAAKEEERIMAAFMEQAEAERVAVEDAFRLAFAQIEGLVHLCAVDHGWWETERGGAEAVALMHSELSEALEYMRKGNGMSDHIPTHTGVEEEFADVIIRIMDYAGHHNLNIAGALIDKVRFNEARPHKHGGKAF